MVKIKLICVGGLKERYFIQAADEYVKRLGRFCKIEVCEIPERKSGIKHTEGFTVVLDKGGRQFGSEEFARHFKQLTDKYGTLTFIIGGSNGLDEGVKQSAGLVLSLGKPTYPHHLFRVMLLEQVYRAFMINSGSEYHK